MLESRIRRYLNDIIDVAFADSPPRERSRYKDFKLQIDTKELRSSNGVYYWNDHMIKVYNPSRGDQPLAKTCLHELSHHIDYMQHGPSGHQQSFYAIYARLIYAALDMGILSPEDFNDDWSRDQSRVRSILANYIPHRVNYRKPSYKVLKVYNAFRVKDYLKAYKYRWNGVEQVWEKTIEDDEENEIELMNALGISDTKPQNENSGIPWYTIKDPSMMIEAVVYIEAAGDTYPCKEILKNIYGFFYNPTRKTWQRKVTSSQSPKELLAILRYDTRLNGCSFSFLNRKQKR